MNPNGLAEVLISNLPAMIAAFIPASLVAVVTAFLTAKFAIKRFHSERWWERKTQAYSDILEQLSILVFDYDTRLTEEMGFFEPGEGRQATIAQLQSAARLKVERISATGAFYISERSAQALRKVT